MKQKKRTVEHPDYPESEDEWKEGTNKFNLKEKRKELMEQLILWIPTKAGRIYRIIREQDKEFIKSIKELIKGDYHWEWTWQEIDKLAGEIKE